MSAEIFYIQGQLSPANRVRCAQKAIRLAMTACGRQDWLALGVTPVLESVDAYVSTPTPACARRLQEHGQQLSDTIKRLNGKKDANVMFVLFAVSELAHYVTLCQTRQGDKSLLSLLRYVLRVSGFVGGFIEVDLQLFCEKILVEQAQSASE